MATTRETILTIAFIALMLATGRIASQNPNVRNFDPRTGLSSSECYYMIQDRHGYVWIAGDGGVSRFNGKEFNNFSTKDGLSDNTIFRIHEDHRGRIWFVCYSGAIDYYFNGKIYNIAANDTLRKAIQYGSEAIVSFHVDKGDTVWVSYNYKEYYVKIPPDQNHRRAQFIRKCEATRNLIFFKGSKSPVYTAKTTNHPLGPLRISTPDDWNEFDTEEGNNSELPISVRLLTYGQDIFLSIYDMLYHFSGKKLVVKRRFNTNIVALNLDLENNLWVGGYQKGVQRFVNRDLNSEPQSFFNGITITHTLQDIENGFWFSTLEKGLLYAPSIEVIHIDLPGKPQGIISLSGIGSDLYAGSSTGELHRICPEPHTGRPTVAQTINVDGQRTNILLRHGNNLLVNSGGEKGGLRVIDNDGRVLHRFILNGIVIGGSGLHITPDSLILVGGLYEVMKFDPRFRLLSADTFPVRINCVHMGADKILYIGCKNGLWQLKDSVVYLGNRYPSLAFPVQQIYTDRRSRLWISTKGGGVSVFDGQNLTQIDSGGTVLSRNCSHLTEDHLGRIWVGSGEGLYRIDADGKNIKRYGVENGLRTNEIHTVKYLNGFMFVGTSLGLEYFSLSADLTNTTPPPVMLREITVDDRPVPLSAHIAELPHDHNDIEFTFIGLTFKGSRSRTYRYKLHGYDADWKITLNENVKYTNLPPGEYRFEVFALNNDRIASTRPASVPFTIALPWWHEPWAIAGAATGSALTIALATFVLVRRVKTQQEKKSRIDQLLVESRLTALRAQMNPHFIFNVINSIQHFILLNDKERAYDYLARFSRLIRMVLDNSRKTSVSLEKEIQLLTLYIELEKLRFDHELDFNIVVKTDLSPEYVSLPNMLIQPYVENAIIHGIAPKRARGAIEVQFIQQGNVLKAVVSDNGIGRKRSGEIRKSGWHKSAGMSITAERLKIIGEAAKRDIQVRITDLHDDNGSPAGTRVELNIPLS